jgi:ribonuclease HI
MRKAIAYIDGSGNSARIQACATVLTLDGVDHMRTKLLPRHTTNNVGEYSGLLLALGLAQELNVEALHVRSDSLLIVNQMNRTWKCDSERLARLRNRALSLTNQFEFSIEWVPRKENEQADALCRRVIKAAEESPTNPFFSQDPIP